MRCTLQRPVHCVTMSVSGAVPVPPFWGAYVLVKRKTHGRMQSLLQVELYTNMAGGCERIFKTPIPPAYAR